MAHYPQTHLQLYNQLLDASYSIEDLKLVDTSYRFAMRLFAGHYRPNNKPFLMHLVGVAGILASVRQPGFVVAAGLLHSAYSLGLHRKGSQIKPHHRSDLVEALGASTEQLIYDYSNRRWSVLDFSGLEGDLDSLSAEDRNLYLIKLADVHEEFLDAGHLYQPRKKLLWDEATDSTWLEKLPVLIERLGYESWAGEFRHALGRNKQTLPPALSGQARHAYILAPGWTDNRFRNRLVRWLSRY